QRTAGGELDGLREIRGLDGEESEHHVLRLDVRTVGDLTGANDTTGARQRLTRVLEVAALLEAADPREPGLKALLRALRDLHHVLGRSRCAAEQVHELAHLSVSSSGVRPSVSTTFEPAPTGHESSKRRSR